MISRRQFLMAGTALAGSASLPADLLAQAVALRLDPALPEGVRDAASLETLPGKKPLIRLTQRPPNYESLLEYFRTPITPNDEFFVRYHLAGIPEQIDARAWHLAVGGEGAQKAIELTLDDLRAMPAVEIVAVNQCSGNRRGLFKPHVPGVEWGYGAMGCARWKGARLKDILDRAGLKKEAIEIAFNGADRAVSEATPDFVKSLPAWKAIEDTTLVAYEMNGAPLPHLNGFPVRLVVPGWTGTYWMKHLASIDALTKPLDSFWMTKAYRIPLGQFPLVTRFASQETATNTPITEMLVNSLITSHDDGASVKAGTQIGGIAWDGGYGITSVDMSTDGGKNWEPAKLGEDLGRFAFRPFSAPIDRKGSVTVMARATNRIGQTQTSELNFNPAGYHHNVIHAITLQVS